MADRGQVSWAVFESPYTNNGLVKTQVVFGAVVDGTVKTKYGAVATAVTVGASTDGRGERFGVVDDQVTVNIATLGETPLTPSIAAGGLAFLFGDFPVTTPQGFVSTGITFGATVSGDIQAAAPPVRAGLSLFWGATTQGAVPGPPAPEQLATPRLSVAWATDPLATPSFVDVSDYLRQLNVRRGRSYEYDRMETGVSEQTLSNRDSRFDPDNASGPYYPNLKPTRRIAAAARWNSTDYPLMTGFTEGYPQEFPGAGFDAVVRLSASDWFYPLNATKFTPAATTLTTAITTTPAADTVETIHVVSTALPLPQAFPFTIQIGTGDTLEQMEVLSSPGPGQWQVKRGQNQTFVARHSVGDEVRSEAVSFAEEQSGARINHCLDILSIASADRDIDAGNSLIAASDNLAGRSVLEHLLLIAEAENGRFFAARTGRITFRQRHWQFTSELNPRAVFGADVDFLADGGNVLQHDDTKLFNRIRIKLPTGQIVEAYDQTSIDAHFERVLEMEWPLASEIEAQDAAAYMLDNLKEAQLRIPQITLRPRGNEMPVVLQVDIGQRYKLNMDPPVGTTVLSKEVIVERVAHQARPGDWVTTLEFSEANVLTYWVLNGSQLGTDTKLAY